MAIEPIDEDPHVGRPQQPARLPRKLDARPAPKTKIVNVLIKVVGAHLQRELDGCYVAGVLKRVVNSNDAKVTALSSWMMRPRHLDLAVLAVDHVVRDALRPGRAPRNR